MSEHKIGLIIDDDFAFKHIPPYPKPSFISFENPYRIKFILDHLAEWNLIENDKLITLSPRPINDTILELAHSKYHIDSIKRVSNVGGGVIGEEVFVSKDTFLLARKAVGGAIRALECVINNEVSQSFALIRPPGHHAMREAAAGLCIFNNIANAILYIRKYCDFKEKIAIIDIDNHFGDGLARYFYEDPSVLYYSIHEFDFGEGDLGMINEIGIGEGLGTNINIPIPPESTNEDFFECFELMETIIRQYKPELIIIATGFDMYFADPIGNCLFTSKAYYEFAKFILNLSKEICHGNISFILEGGYSLTGLPYCVKAIIKALLNEELFQPEFELNVTSLKRKDINEVQKINEIVKEIIKPFWDI
ncbi:MAG: histone deacetylase [Candidatus Lokiarchaeota archaeon]|nr:histone deacetylase [Candidatus Lokiarchaeota archaeon]